MLIAPITDIRGDEAILDEDHRKQLDWAYGGDGGKTPADLIDQAKRPEQAASAFPGHAGFMDSGRRSGGCEGDWHRE